MLHTSALLITPLPIFGTEQSYSHMRQWIQVSSAGEEYTIRKYKNRVNRHPSPLKAPGNTHYLPQLWSCAADKTLMLPTKREPTAKETCLLSTCFCLNSHFQHRRQDERPSPIPWTRTSAHPHPVAQLAMTLPNISSNPDRQRIKPFPDGFLCHGVECREVWKTVQLQLWQLLIPLSWQRFQTEGGCAQRR